jgi:hypothetical protein
LPCSLFAVRCLGLASGLALASCFTAACFAEDKEFEVRQPDVEALAKFGVVKVSSDSSVELDIPAGFIGDTIKGRVLVINDTNQDLPLSEVETSCGCTSAIPVQREVVAGKAVLILMDYQAKAVGESRIEAQFDVGSKPFHLYATARTKPRLTPNESALTFDEHGRAAFSFRKHVATPINRFDALPTSLKVENVIDDDAVVRATLVRETQKTPTSVVIIPAYDDQSHPQTVFHLRYPGHVEALPRSVIASDSGVKFFLRGDVETLSSAKTITLRSRIPEFEKQSSCEVAKLGAVVSVTMKVDLEPGDYTFTATLSDISFPLSITVR